MKNIEQIKRLIVECCQNSIEIRITVYDEFGYKCWWGRINTINNKVIPIETACIYPNYHITLNLSPIGTSIKIYFLAGLKIQTSFKDATLSVNVNNYEEY